MGFPSPCARYLSICEALAIVLDRVFKQFTHNDRSLIRERRANTDLPPIRGFSQCPPKSDGVENPAQNHVV